MPTAYRSAPPPRGLSKSLNGEGVVVPGERPAYGYAWWLYITRARGCHLGGVRLPRSPLLYCLIRQRFILPFSFLEGLKNRKTRITNDSNYVKTFFKKHDHSRFANRASE